MSAPPKPWERAGTSATSVTNVINDGRPPFLQQGASGPLDPLHQSAGPSTMSSPAATAVPPPVPMRSTIQGSYGGGLGGYTGGYGSSYGGIGSYGGFGSGSMYSPYGAGMYGSSMYGGYGSMGMNRFGQGDIQPNSFVQMAEENSRQAFQSIEGIVQAFGSVAMMLESTYSAVYNSFRAVIGVADHFSRMKANFAQIFSALAIVRTLRWLVKKLLVLLRLRESAPNEEIWTEAAVAGMDTALPGSKKPNTSWPLLLFFAVIMGGPWLIWRFLSSLAQKQADSGAWASGEDEHFVALAEHDFNGEKDDELSFRHGQRINIAPKELQPRIRGWLMASVDGKQVGVIPANYVKILGKRPGTRITTSALVPSDPAQQYTGPAPLPNQPLGTGTSTGTSVQPVCFVGNKPEPGGTPGRDLESVFSEVNDGHNFGDLCGTDRETPDSG